MPWRLCSDGDEFEEIYEFYKKERSVEPEGWKPDDLVSVRGVATNCWKDKYNQVEDMIYDYHFSFRRLNVLACLSASSWGYYFSFKFPDEE